MCSKCEKRIVQAEAWEKKHLSAQFWAAFIARHRLVGTVGQSLPVPKGEESVSKELDASIRLCHHPNPAQKTTARLQRFLQYAPQLNETEFFGLLKASFQSPSLSRQMSVQMLEAGLAFCARTRADLLHPHLFEHVKDSWDQLMVASYQKSRSDKMSRSHFMRAHRCSLQLFVDMEVATKVDIQVSSGEAPCPEDIQTLMKSSEIGNQLFNEEAMALESSAFAEDISRRLIELEMTVFECGELASFKRILMCTAENFDVDTWESFDGKKETVEFCAAEVGCILMNPNDLWQHKLDARVKALLISIRKLRRLPHEEWLFGKEGPIQGCPSTVEVGEDLIYDAVNARDYLLQVIGSSNFMSAHTLKKWCSRTKKRFENQTSRGGWRRSSS